MHLFDLPTQTIVHKIIPKNSFDRFTNTKQKRAFTDNIQRIQWVNKLAPDTINLEAGDIGEIQVFRIELKQKRYIPGILEIIEKVIPYHVVFTVEFQDEVYISTAAKHPHPVNENKAVIDWVFTSKWQKKQEFDFRLNLKESIDWVYKNLCLQLTNGKASDNKQIGTLIEHEKEVASLEKQIQRLRKSMKSAQFNKKVEINLKVKSLEAKLIQIKSQS